MISTGQSQAAADCNGRRKLFDLRKKPEVPIPAEVVRRIEKLFAIDGELIVDEIQRPASIGPRFDQDRRTGADSTPPGFPLADGKTFLAIKAVDAIDAGRFSVPPKQDE